MALNETTDIRVGVPAQADDNAAIAAALREAAAVLHAQHANPFRIEAYRVAANSVEQSPQSVRLVFERGGRAGLDELPGVGPGIAGAIAEMLTTGRWGQLERLRGGTQDHAVFRSVAGIGEVLARRIHDALGVDTLEALEAAAIDGRLARVQGVGPRRARAIAAVLGQMLDRGRVRRTAASTRGPVREPPVELLLEIDAGYRERAQAGSLPTIAPRRFNPKGLSWLPVWHTHSGPWHVTALFSNTGRAHELGRERDWVVLFFHDDDMSERQCTVVTETRGTLVGRRVVRGREAECRDWYEHGAPA